MRLFGKTEDNLDDPADLPFYTLVPTLRLLLNLNEIIKFGSRIEARQIRETGSGTRERGPVAKLSHASAIQSVIDHIKGEKREERQSLLQVKTARDSMWLLVGVNRDLVSLGVGEDRHIPERITNLGLALNDLSASILDPLELVAQVAGLGGEVDHHAV